MKRVMNFNAGPGTLPLPALERAQRELLDFAGTGMSVMEHSHRGKDYTAVHEEAEALLKELTGVGDAFDVLFLHGGASMQFAQIPLSFLPEGKSADYVVSGVWGDKAFAEGKVVADMRGAKVRLAGNSAEGEGEEKTWTHVPRQKQLSLDPEAAYLHFTSNETIHGVEYALSAETPFPDAGKVPLVCDMSSDFLWKPVDLSRFAMVYAGAQKNIGPSGICVALMNKHFLAQARKDVPKMLRYDVAAANDSLYNTPSTFGVYLIRNVLQWCKDEGGLAGMEKRNRAKAKAVYDAIDATPALYRCPVEPAARSVMNIVFRLPSAELEEKFVSEAKARGMVGLKGHRTVGGIRVSLYNAVPVEWATALATFMGEFAKARA